jgi:Protein of unknown function (DUF982)
MNFSRHHFGILTARCPLTAHEACRNALAKQCSAEDAREAFVIALSEAGMQLVGRTIGLRVRVAELRTLGLAAKFLTKLDELPLFRLLLWWQIVRGELGEAGLIARLRHKALAQSYVTGEAKPWSRRVSH